MYKGQLWLETGTSHGSTGGEFLLYFKGKADEIFYKTKGGVWEEKKKKSRPKSGLNDRKTGVSLNEMGNAEETGRLREE